MNTEERKYLDILLSGNTISCQDLELHDLSKDERTLVQVYKKRHLFTDKKGKVNRVEYNVLHRNYIDAVKDYLRLKEVYFGKLK